MQLSARKLLSNSSAKALAAVKYGWFNVIHYMSPYDIAGVGNLCPWASEGCKAVCLGYHSGQAGLVKNASNTANKNHVRKSRDAKAVEYMARREFYLKVLINQIDAAEIEAVENGMKLCVRLNGSTDVCWRKVYEQRPAIQFSEYTKSLKRMLSWLAGDYPSNVHITFSRSETNWQECEIVLARGGNVAVVFDKIPETFRGYNIINGDEHDLRHLDTKAAAGCKGNIIALKAKGAARKDLTGFVLRPESK